MTPLHGRNCEVTMPPIKEPTANEQFFLEMLNRARLDPAAEAARFGIGLNDPTPGNPDDTPSVVLTPDAKQPLAYNSLVGLAAEGHSQDMLDRDYFAHEAPAPAPNGTTPGDRMESAGYTFTGSWTWGENIAWSGTTGEIDLDASILSHHEGLFKSAGHRVNILNDAFRETGVSQVAGEFTAPDSEGVEHDYNASMLTNKFATSGSDIFLTGVVHDDLDGDLFYSPGEGRAGVSVSASGGATTSATAGGYALALAEGTTRVEVTFDWDGTPGTATLDMGGRNAKFDIVGGTRLMSSADLELGAGVVEAGLLGVEDLSLTGNEFDNLLIAGRGNNTIDGGSGDDIVQFAGLLADYEITVEAGTITVTDTREDHLNEGVNTLMNVATLRFADGDHVLEPSLDPGDGPVLLSGVLSDLAGDAIAGAEVTFTPEGETAPALGMTSDGAGAFALGLEEGASGQLDAQRDHGSGDPAIASGDALDVLRLAVGLEPSFGPAQSAHFVAADINENGAVTPNDALEVLRHAVGLASDHAPKWVFFDAATDWAALTLDADNAALPRGMEIASLDSDLEVEMTGILLGNMATL
ncbi:CAP domain-containing protein [Aquicoccus porphyridii]|uniref:CAP domain-containing protein n=1 Tax=Aquicoccus porphyridii TaxID=1852029 RepID=A0A5A9ZVB5_9RHOB|nr:CAP domain-containing protein [Aquicoccus porphyridii]KAA0921160.1 CAP domain-containing protein [Aquicoccus porphyridii]RAI56309.1 hypothetical protein DOO74_00045 [Rhodobacteraceae bacterium AsT-22]